MKAKTSENTMSNAGRNLLADVLKGLAVIMMIQVHITELFAIPLWQNSLAGRWSLFLGGPPAAPVFMVLMGFFSISPSINYSGLFIRGLRLLLFGLLLNAGLNLHLILKFISGQIQVNIWQFIFGVDIFFLAGFSLMLIAFVKQMAGNRLIIWVLLLFVLGFLNRFLPEYKGQSQWIQHLQAYFYGSLSWSYFPLFPWGAYPVAGVISKIILEKVKITAISDKLHIVIFIVFSTLLLSTFSFGFKSVTDLQVYYHHTGVMVLWNLSFVLWEALLMYFLFNPGSKAIATHWLAWAGKNVTPFYVFQWLIIGNLATWLYQSQFPLQLLFWFLFTLFVSGVFTMLWQKFKQKIKLRDKLRQQR